MKYEAFQTHVAFVKRVLKFLYVKKFLVFFWFNFNMILFFR